MLRFLWLILMGGAMLEAQTLKVFVLTGQSNSLGTLGSTDTTMLRGAPGTHAAEQAGGVPFFWDNRADGTSAGDVALGDSGGWVTLAGQAGGYYTGNDDHWGPEIGFSRMLWDAGYRDFAVVKASRGGGGNSFWVKGSTDDHMYRHVVGTLQAAVSVLPSGYTGVEIAGLLWVQGESNDVTEADQAGSRLTGLLENLKADLAGASGLKGVVGEIGGGSSADRDLTRTRQSALASSDAGIGYARSVGTVQHDGLHYDADSILLLGERMASEAIGAGCFSAEPMPAWADLNGWYVGDRSAVPDGSGDLARWGDLSSGSGRYDLTRTVGGRPSALAVTVTGGGEREVMGFDGTEDIWITAGDFGSLDGPRSVAMLCRVNGSSDGYLFDGSTASGRTRVQVRGGDWQAGVGTQWDGAEAVTAVRQLGLWQRHVFTFNEVGGGTEIGHWIDGVEVATPSDGDSGALGGLILGSNGGSPFEHLAIDVAEAAVWNRLLGPVDVAALETAWNGRWGMITGPPFEVEVRQDARDVARFGWHGLIGAEVAVPQSGTKLTEVRVSLKAGTRAHAKGLRLLATGGGFNAGGEVLGEVVNPTSDTIVFPLDHALVAGQQGFWVAVEPQRWSSFGSMLDATVDELIFSGNEAGSVVPGDADPAGVLTLAAVPLTSTVRASGDFGVNTYRIPGIVSDAGGVLHAVFDHRWTGGSDLPADVDVGYARSTDGGGTWSGFQAIMDYDKNVQGSSDNGVGDPCILLDPVTETLWVAALWSFGNNGYNGSGGGTDPASTGQYVLTKSDDGGLTWSAPINVTVPVKDDVNWRLIFQGPGHGLAMRDGTLVFPSQYRDAGGVVRSCSVYSSDHGVTWDFGSGVPTGSPQTNENTVCELDDGDLLFSMRTPSGSNGQRAWIRYTPGGAEAMRDGSWGSLYRLPSVPDPVCQGSVVQWTSTHRGAPREKVVFVNPATSSSRVNLTLRVSGDGGATWPVSRLIDPGPGAYSSVCVLPDQSVGILYEDENYTRLTFVRVEEAWVWNESVDGDGDDMPDAWEVFHGTNELVDDSGADSDHDGMSHLQEYLSGTDPLNGDSVLKVTGSGEVAGEFFVEWSSIPGREYVVEESDDLESWDDVGRVSAGSASASLTIPMIEPRKFVRVRVQ